MPTNSQILDTAEQLQRLNARILEKLTEYASDARQDADEMAERYPGSSSAEFERGRAHGLEIALLLSGGSLPARSDG